MSDVINLINIFTLSAREEDGVMVTEAEPTDNFNMLFPESDLMGRMFRMHVTDFFRDLLHFISTRLAIVSGSLSLEDMITEREGMDIYLCIDSSNRCVLHTEEMDFMFSEMCDTLTDEEYETFGTFLKFLALEIRDMEEDLTEDMNDSWNMKEKGFGIEVLKVE